MGRQKARCWTGRPCDLAPKLVDQIFDIIAELHAAGTTILVEQNALMALQVASRGYVLKRATTRRRRRYDCSSTTACAAYLGSWR